MSDKQALFTTYLPFGADPELFFISKTTRRVIGSERVLPPGGFGRFGVTWNTDGVQAELHPGFSTCRALFSNSISVGFSELKTFLAARPKIDVSFSQVVPVSKIELERLGSHAQTLGCQPSLNAYDEPQPHVDGRIYRRRSAAGHIHLGINTENATRSAQPVDKKSLVKLLDVMVGNTMVLFDRDPHAAIRRKYYGRAGEYRTPKHGLEYRVPSNVWLRGYPLLSLILSLTRTAFSIEVGALDEKVSGLARDARARIIGAVTEEEVRTAINTNDLKLAQSVFDRAVRPIMQEVNALEGLADTEFYVPDIYDYKLHKYVKAQPIFPGITLLQCFDHFLTKPLAHWFPMDPIEHWATKGDGHNCGWESFCYKTLAPSLEAERKKLTLTTKVVTANAEIHA